MSDRVVRYSEAFKLQVVDELARGVYGSPFAAAQAYGIGSVSTVRRWLVQYGKEELLKKVVRVEKRGEATELEGIHKGRILRRNPCSLRAREKRSHIHLYCRTLKPAMRRKWLA